VAALVLAWTSANADSMHGALSGASHGAARHIGTRLDAHDLAGNQSLELRLQNSAHTTLERVLHGDKVEVQHLRADVDRLQAGLQGLRAAAAAADEVEVVVKGERLAIAALEEEQRQLHREMAGAEDRACERLRSLHVEVRAHSTHHTLCIWQGCDRPGL
jgi:hypothetical protein